MDQVWDTQTQEVHGGQTWRQCNNFISDFSVTTNALGTPTPALLAAKGALSDIQHYPPADNREAVDAISNFISFPASQTLIGNGASEFIDLAMKTLPPGPFKPGPYRAAYMEYNRAATAAGRKVLSADSEAEAAVTVLIHPNSPTGDFMELDDLREYLVGLKGALVVDESFMPFHGPDWRQHSALGLVEEFPDRLLVLSSWTKLWSCPGIRLGSISASKEHITKIKKLQTPWSCNTPAQHFAVSAANDTDYMERTWRLLPPWKTETEERVRKLGWIPNELSPAWVPWVFVTCPSEEIAKRASDVAQNAGCPVRNCKSFGAGECLRLGVRKPEHQAILFEVWETEFGAAHQNGNGEMNGNH